MKRTSARFGSSPAPDLIGVSDKAKRAKEVVALGAEFVEMHAGLDEQAEEGFTFATLLEDGESADAAPAAAREPAAQPGKGEASRDEINALMQAAAEQSKVLGYNTLPLVSTDFNHNPLSSIFDANHTKGNGKLVKVMAWYDNEWGFSNRMLDNCLTLINAK